MLKLPRVSAKDYYDNMPTAANSSGDIWTDMPTFGLLGSERLPAIVITPACDLANRKVETVTYLPLISVRAYFASTAYLPVVLAEIDRLLTFLKTGQSLSTNRFFPPASETVGKVEEEIQKLLKTPCLGSKEKQAAERILAGTKICRCLSRNAAIEPAASDLSALLGDKVWTAMVERIVKNAYATDLHFLPADEQPTEWSAVSAHSVVLFRYPITVPVEVLECAQDVSLQDWGRQMTDLAEILPVANAFKAVRPMKRITLRARFLADLITRYVGMHVRLGSPDFTAHTVSEYVKEIGQ